MFMRIKLFIYLICLLSIGPAMLSGLSGLSGSKANAGELLTRYVYTSSALIIELRHPASRPDKYQRYAGFQPDHKIGPYIRPNYLEPKHSRSQQRYTGFKKTYEDQCYQCQRYTGFKKTYSGQRYSGFTNDYLQSRYLVGYSLY